MHLFSKKQSIKIKAFSNGEIVNLENIPDVAFKNKLIGDGLALKINSNHIFAPCKGKITIIARTKHAFTITLPNNAELLIHIGLYNDEIPHNTFTYHVEINDKVEEDTPIVTISDDFLKANNNEITVILVILNYKEHPIYFFNKSNHIKQGQTLFKVR